MINKQYFITINGESLSVDKCRNLARVLVNGKDHERELGEFLLFLSDETKDKLLIETSGSTGKPKKIEVSKAQLICSAKETIEALNLKKGDVSLLALPVKYIGGKMMVVRAMVGGLNLITTNPSNQILTEELPSTTINFAALTPAQLYPILENKEALLRLNQIDKLIIGGAAVNKTLRNALKHYKKEIYETYGMTETLSHIALRQLAPAYELEFKALKGVNLNKDEEGCLIISSESRGIFDLKTNDLVELISKNSFVLKGRKDDVINSGGVKVNPEELESEIELLLNRKVIISYKLSQMYGQELVLVLDGEDLSDNQKSEIIHHVKAKFKASIHPKKVIVFPFYPMTESGKINRKVVAELINQTH